MSRSLVLALYVLAMVVVIVGVDVTFFRSHFWNRLAVNIAIVLAFGAVYWAFLKGYRGPWH